MKALAKLPIIDCHVHLRGLPGIDDQMRLMDECSLSAINLVCTSARRPSSLCGNPLALMTKAAYPGKFFVFGGLNYCVPGGISKEGLARQAEELLAPGCDGVKMIEGKPTARKATGLALDAEVYDGFYGVLESHAMPIVYHVADPETWWDPNLAPEPVRQRGDGYWSDPQILAKEALYAEAEGVLRKFPKLRVIFAHFYFMSDFPDRAGEFMDRWPEISFDLTPGSEMYRNFSKRPDRWREFFVRYQDRILFGTDNIWPHEPREERYRIMADKVAAMRRFLETDDEFEAFRGTIRGLKLPKGVLAKIYAGNFRRYAGRKPRKPNLRVAMEMCRRAIEAVRDDNEQARTLAELREILSRLEKL